jgi:cytochrome c
MPVRKLRLAIEIGLGICGAVVAAEFATAQISPPPAKPPDGAALFKQQCATCHTTNLSDPQRQGPSLFKVMGRQAGKLDGFHYSAGFAQADFSWDESRLDAWLTNPQAVIPSAIMAYRQPKAETRAAIIGYLRELN